MVFAGRVTRGVPKLKTITFASPWTHALSTALKNRSVSHFTGSDDGLNGMLNVLVWVASNGPTWGVLVASKAYTLTVIGTGNVGFPIVTQFFVLQFPL